MENKKYLDITTNDFKEISAKVASKNETSKIITVSAKRVDQDLNKLIKNHQVKKAMTLLADA